MFCCCLANTLLLLFWNKDIFTINFILVRDSVQLIPLCTSKNPHTYQYKKSCTYLHCTSKATGMSIRGWLLLEPVFPLESYLLQVFCQVVFVYKKPQGNLGLLLKLPRITLMLVMLLLLKIKEKLFKRTHFKDW